MFCLRFCYQFQQSKNILVVMFYILEPSSMFDGKISHRYIINPAISPMKQFINHKGACHTHDGMYCTLFSSVQMLCPRTRKTVRLTPFVEFFEKHVWRKNFIISMIMMHLYSRLIPHPYLIFLISHNGFTCSKKSLVLHPNNTIRYFPTKTRLQPTRCFLDKLISRH